jgi:hypothetical protein
VCSGAFDATWLKGSFHEKALFLIDFTWMLILNQGSGQGQEFFLSILGWFIKILF